MRLETNKDELKKMLSDRYLDLKSEWKSEEVEPARLRAGRQRVGRVGCFQIYGIKGWRGMDVFVQRGECFGRMNLMGELQCMYDENLKKATRYSTIVSTYQTQRPVVGESKHLTRKGHQTDRRHDFLSALRTIRRLLYCPYSFSRRIQYRNIKNLEPKGC